MAQLLPVKMSKFDNQPWGFRLQGGIDFAAPLTIQKVNAGSLAEKAGLQAGDGILKINDVDVFNMRHKEAQETVIKAGNNFEVLISRGDQLKPKFSDPLPLPAQANIPPRDASLTKAPLAASSQTTDGNVSLINNQFNSPMALYSEESIAETLSSQAEVLAQGVLGVNFKKNEKTYNPANSEVFKMVQDLDRQPREPEPVHVVGSEPTPAALGLRPVGRRITEHPMPPAQAFPNLPSAIKASPNVVEESYSEQVSTVHESKYFTSQSSVGYKIAPTFGVHPVQAPQGPALKPTFEPKNPEPPAAFAPRTGLGAAMAKLPSAPAPPAPAAPPAAGSGSGVSSAPRRGKGILSQVGPGARIPVCSSCDSQIRGRFVTALGLTWCPNHFVCAMQQCRRPLQDVGFVEEKNELYCETCFENYLAPTCCRCQKRIKGDCLNAISKQFHPECFACTYCGRLFGNSHFYLEDGLPYCEADWNELFTTKCFACGFPIEAGDRWVEAMNNNYHSQCFTCAVCKKNLEGQSFLGKGGRPMCKSHVR